MEPQAAALIISTYQQLQHLDRCLTALRHQSVNGFEVLVADDGSGAETAQVIDAHRGFFGQRLRHVWQADQGFRKTRILNLAMLETRAEYLIFTDGDCLLAPDFIHAHLYAARPGHYLKGTIIRLGAELSDKIDRPAIASGAAFHAAWLLRQGRAFDRRYLKLLMGKRARRLFDQLRTGLYWLGANASCFRADALAVNGFDLRFTYGFEDGDFGNRLCNYGIRPRSVRYSANALHLHHARPYRDQLEMARNRALVTPQHKGRRFRAIAGIEQLEQEAA